MIREEIGYSYNDVTIIPAEISEVGSRSECNPFYRDNDLPIFAAPMSSVISEENYQDFIDEGVTPVIPRSVPLNERVTMLLNGIWTAVSLQEFIDLFIEDESDYYETIITGVKYNVCVDIANGHMLRLYDICERAKRESIARGYELVIMTGNIANAETYNYICWCNKTMQEELGINTVDYIRCGIGAGFGCFVDGTKITMENGTKVAIEDVNVGDFVLSHDGSYNKVLSKVRYKSIDNKITINDSITCTADHKFFVVNKKDSDIITEENLEKYGYWIPASELDKDKHLLVKRFVGQDV